ncbi:MAG: amidase [Jatrophihabitans sp.]
MTGADELGYLGVAELRGMLDRRELSARELTAASLDRIERLDDRLHSVIELNPEALADADASASHDGPLAGIPVLLKDNVDTMAPMHTTAGSLALADGFAAADAPIVTAIRAAGAIILGKANLSEWANYRSAGSTSGWSAVGGLTANPHDLSRSAGGSSSGSGAAVAAGLAPLAIGTETDGSISCPASLNGVVGVKPTVGLASRTGIVPISVSQDTPGPIARSVPDAALLLAVIAGSDPADEMTSRPGRPAKVDYVAAARPGRLDGLRIGVPSATSLFGYHRGMDAVVLAAIEVLADLGAEIIDEVDLPGIDQIEGAELTVMDHELKDGLARYLATRPDGPRSLADLIAFNQEHADEELTWFGQEVFARAVSTDGLQTAAYREARAKCIKAGRDDGIDGALQTHRLDALAMPSYSPAWVSDLVLGDKIAGGCSTLPAVAGYPLLSVPCGTVPGPVAPLPVGLALTASAWSEPMLLRIAAAYEDAAPSIVRPTGI